MNTGKYPTFVAAPTTFTIVSPMMSHTMPKVSNPQDFQLKDQYIAHGCSFGALL